MGPRSMSAEIVRASAEVVQVRQSASMGPRSMSAEMQPTTVYRARLVSPRFNGAALR